MVRSSAAEVILNIAAERDAMGFKMAEQCRFDVAVYLFRAAQRDRLTAARVKALARSAAP